MENKELQNKIVCKVFDLEEKFIEVSATFRDLARLLMKFEEAEEEVT